MFKLLSREEFRKQVFTRDGFKCVICSAPAQDAHHILERRLWIDGGYYLENGASVCGPCHLLCESTDISVEALREYIGIAKFPLPEHFYSDQQYDKWGNIIITEHKRLAGELFQDKSVQKILREKLHLFVPYVKYPRTYHLPWSGNMNEDDRMLLDLSAFKGQDIVVTEKLDGENTTMYNDYIHARSLDSRHHYSRDWIKNFWQQNVGYNLPKGWRVCVENMWATHSIKYTSLPSYCMGFSVWNDQNICLSWKETQDWFELLNITSVPILYTGKFEDFKHPQLDWTQHEGYVMRLASEFSYRDFRTSVAKYVRKNHVQTVKHWMFGQQLEKNELQ